MRLVPAYRPALEASYHLPVQLTEDMREEGMRLKRGWKGYRNRE